MVGSSPSKSLGLNSLSMRITMIVIGAFLLVETLALIPSAYHFKNHVIEDLRKDALSAVATTLTPEALRDHVDLAHHLRLLTANPVISGVEIWPGSTPQNSIRYGKEMTWANPTMLSGDLGNGFKEQVVDDTLEIMVALPSFDDGTILGISVDISHINEQVVAYILQVAGLVLIIAAIIGGATIASLNFLVIRPINRIQHILSQQDASLDKNLLDRQDEVGKAAKSAAYLVSATRKDHDKLTAAIFERTVQLNRANVLLETELTARREAMQRLKESEQQFRNFAESALDIFWETDSDFRVTFLSARYDEITGNAATKIIGKRYEDLRTPDTPDEIWDEHISDVHALKPFRAFRYKRVKPTGEDVYLEISGVPSFNESGTFVGYRGSITNISVVANVERHLRESRDIAEKANRAKTDFLSSMSHELRTPLNAILGFAQLLESDPSITASARAERFVHQIHRSGDALLSLITKILSLEDIERGVVSISLKACPVLPVIQDCIDISQIMPNPYNVVVKSVTDPDFQDIALTDSEHLKTAIMNVLSNAISYNVEGGTVTISLETLDNSWIRIKVNDTGQGIKAADLDRAFEPFDRLGRENQDIEGTGVGLSITRQLVERMGGRVHLESEFAKGTTFFIDIPQAHNHITETALTGEMANNIESNPSKVLSAKPLPTLAAQPRVLNIEDNPANAELMRSIFARRPNIIFDLADDGQSGIDVAQSTIPNVVLLDIDLPDMSGYSVFQALKTEETTREIPVVAVSASVRQSDIDHAMAMGFHAYVKKPINVTELLTMIDGIIDA